MEIKTVLFDLDGTLTDSGPGITAGVQYALNKYGMEVDDFSRLRCFIGPPLKEQFQKFCGFSDEEGVRAVESLPGVYTGIKGFLKMRSMMAYRNFCGN